MMIKNEEAFKKALETLSENDRKTLEAFAHFLLVSSNSSIAPVVFHQPQKLLYKANNALLKDYVQLTVSKIDQFNQIDTLEFWFEGRDKPQSFPNNWFKSGNSFLTMNILNKPLFVKFRSGTNRIDKIAFEDQFLTDLGKTEGKKRILVLNSSTTYPIANIPVAPPITTSSQFVSKLIDAKSDGWANTPYIAQISVLKNNTAFSKLDNFKEGRLKLSRIGEILFNMLDQANNKKFVWDSEFFFGAAHDFTDVKSSKTFDVKCHFHSSERLQLSQNTLDRCDADYIVSILVEEDDSSYTATVAGYISKADFINKTKPWAYNEHVSLRSLELHELNSPKDLF